MDRYVQALTLDLSILERLLVRHRCSHGRAIYFRRLSMVLQATRRHALVEIIMERQWPKLFDKKTLEYSQRCKRKRNPDQWDIRGGDILTDEERSIRSLFDSLQLLWTDAVQEILSRIDHASHMLFLEVSRGFFLPFCAVALGALARIRSLLVKMGRMGLSQLQAKVAEEEVLRKFLSLSKERVHACISQYLQEDGEVVKKSGGIGRLSDGERRESLLKCLGYCSPARVAPQDDVTARGDRGESDDKAGSLDDVHSLELIDGSVPEDQEAEARMNKVGRNKAPAMTLQSEVHDGDEDIGENVEFRSVETSLAALQGSTSRSIATEAASVDPLDRNMEILESFRGKHAASTTSISPSQKPPKKKLKEEKKKSKKKKKKSKADFFDALFD